MCKEPHTNNSVHPPISISTPKTQNLQSNTHCVKSKLADEPSCHTPAAVLLGCRCAGTSQPVKSRHTQKRNTVTFCGCHNF